MNLANLDWETLLQMRREAPLEQQGLLAPYEHRAWAREDVAENPWRAPGYMLLIPAYQAAKAMGMGARTSPSMRQMGHGLLGVAEGLVKAMR